MNREYTVIRVKRETWKRLKILSAIHGRSMSEVADEVVNSGLKEYSKEIEELIKEESISEHN
jgi:predicted DNA-binding protein